MYYRTIRYLSFLSLLSILSMGVSYGVKSSNEREERTGKPAQQLKVSQKSQPPKRKRTGIKKTGENKAAEAPERKDRKKGSLDTAQKRNRRFSVVTGTPQYDPETDTWVIPHHSNGKTVVLSVDASGRVIDQEEKQGAPVATAKKLTMTEQILKMLRSFTGRQEK